MISRLIAIATLACSLTLTTKAQVTLASLANEANAGWMLGSWKGTTDNGDSMELGFKWELDKHMIVLTINAGGMEAKGFTVMEPGSELPSYMGVDNQGSVSKGNWNYEDGALVLRLETKRAYEAPRKWAATFSGSESSGLTVKMHGLESWGGLSYPATATIKLKKQ
ncbi:MAG: hypothetical protein ACO34E_17750 [Limisphaerales bacterium]|jgi:hypothetical protein